MTEQAFYRWQGDDLILQVLLQPKASSIQWVGPVEGRMKIRITAPPIDGQANSQLIEFLAKQFKVAKSQIHLLSGELARQKTLRIQAPRILPAASGISKS
ncbi:MAG: YggU family protein [Moraxellaceae bacterium]|nr:MAG: YggU family protein [Moraxellaceae bacterium]